MKFYNLVCLAFLFSTSVHGEEMNVGRTTRVKILPSNINVSIGSQKENFLIVNAEARISEGFVPVVDVVQPFNKSSLIASLGSVESSPGDEFNILNQKLVFKLAPEIYMPLITEPRSFDYSFYIHT